MDMVNTFFTNFFYVAVGCLIVVSLGVGYYTYFSDDSDDDDRDPP